MTYKLSNIPTELRANGWVHSYLGSPDKKGKQSVKPSQKWATPEARAENLKSLDHVLGRQNCNDLVQRYVDKTEGFIFVDLDGVRNPETGELISWAQRIVDDWETYTEVSRSGKGLHLVGRGTVSEDYHVSGVPVEIYAGNSGKLINMTGDVLDLYVNISNVDAGKLLQRAKAGEFGGSSENEPAKEQPRPPVDIRSWMDTNLRCVGRLKKGPPKWLVGNMIPYKGVTMIAAPQGGSKTALALFLARALAFPLAVDYKFLGRDVQPFGCKRKTNGQFMTPFEDVPDVPVVFIDRENPESVINDRLERMGLMACSDFYYWGDYMENVPATPELILQDELGKIEKLNPLLEKMAEIGTFFLFDSYVDWYGDRKEIDNTAMSELMSYYTRLARLGSGVCLLHHAPADGNKAYRGGTGIVAATEMAIELARVDDNETQSKKSFALKPIRFRMCEEWEIKFEMDWKVPQKVGLPRLEIKLQHDSSAAEIVASEQAARKEKAETNAAKKLDGQIEDACDLEGHILADESCLIGVQQLGKKAGISKNRVARLLKLIGWEKDESGKWTHDAARDVRKKAEVTNDESLPFKS